jgi:putative membrane protein
LVIAAVVAIGCDQSDRRDVTAGNDPAAVGTAGDDRNKISRADEDFVRDITVANLAEIELGKMASERGVHANVKKFGQMMVDDHTKAGNALKPIASEHNLQMSTELDEKHRDLRDKLAKLQGGEFDREYAKAMVDGHEDVADKLESRIDTKSLADWKTKASNRVTGQRAEERIQATSVMPEHSDNAVTMRLNQWAAETYPVVQAHLEAAKALDEAVKNNRRTGTQ